MKPEFFESADALSAWMEKHHDRTPELWVGFYKKGSGKPSITWPESVDAALCFGWIDGVRKRIDDLSYTIRFTPRRARSIWSLINVRRVGELTKARRMQAAGLAAFERRKRSGIYAYEQRSAAKLTEEYKQRFRANKKAWDYFQAQPPGYQRTATWWVISAKRVATRLKRLSRLIENSQHQQTIRAMPVRAKTK